MFTNISDPKIYRSKIECQICSHFIIELVAKLKKRIENLRNRWLTICCVFLQKTFGDAKTTAANTKKGFLFLMSYLSDIVPYEPAACMKVV